MFWDRISGVYDAFESTFNGRVYDHTGEIVAEYIGNDDTVLECACGTGAISVHIAPVCKKLVATDLSVNMLRTAEKKCRRFDNVVFKKADLTALKVRDNSFDAVVAGNVIHLLDDPYAALDELVRVCRPYGRIIIPTYINISNGKDTATTKFFKAVGVEFKRNFDLFSYKAFFEGAGFDDICYELADGRVPCAIAIITNHKQTERN